MTENAESARVTDSGRPSDARHEAAERAIFMAWREAAHPALRTPGRIEGWVEEASKLAAIALDAADAVSEPTPRVCQMCDGEGYVLAPSTCETADVPVSCPECGVSEPTPPLISYEDGRQHDKVWGEGGWVVHYGCPGDETGQPYTIHSVKYHEQRGAPEPLTPPRYALRFSEGERKPGWCDKHDDLAWLYADGSVGCMGALVLETSTVDCSARLLPVYAERDHAQSRAAALEGALRALVAHFDAKQPWHADDGNAPGHAHSRRGIWDDDNGPLSGTECEWCATYEAARALLAESTPKSQED